MYGLRSEPARVASDSRDTSAPSRGERENEARYERAHTEEHGPDRRQRTASTGTAECRAPGRGSVRRLCAERRAETPLTVTAHTSVLTHRDARPGRSGVGGRRTARGHGARAGCRVVAASRRARTPVKSIKRNLFCSVLEFGPVPTPPTPYKIVLLPHFVQI